MVPAREVQSAGTGPVQCPGVPAWPITAPVVGLMNVTEVGWKLGGTCWYGGDWRSGAPPAGGGDAGDVAAGLLRVGDECGRGEAIVVGETLPALTPPAWPREGSRPESACGTVTAPATTTAAPAAAAAAPRRPPARRRSRREAQASRSPSAAFSRVRAWCRSALIVPSGRPSMSATSRTPNPA